MISAFAVCLLQMFGMIARFLNTLAVDDSTKLVVITGNGDYFTSGMDVGEHPPGETKHLSLEKFRFVGSLLHLLMFDYRQLNTTDG